MAVAVLIFSGCTVGPDYRPPETTHTANWGELSTFSSTTHPTTEPASQPATQSSVVISAANLSEWWETFNDPILNSLVSRAIKANPDLRRAQARVREARAQRGVVNADLYPTVNTTGAYTRSRVSKNNGDTSQSTSSAGHEQDLFQAGFDASWEIDVFGGVRRDIEAADADLAAAVEDRRQVAVSLLAEVARNYVELRCAQRQIAIAHANLDAQKGTLDLTRTRLQAGMVSDLDVARAEAQVQTTASQIPTLESSTRQSIHSLSILLGQEPTSLAPELVDPQPIPKLPPQVPIGLPSDLLRRRPDVRRAERQLAAATARIGVATADLFPHFSLTGSLGLESSKLKSLPDYDSRYWSIGPSVSWPILDFGRVRNNVAVQNAREEQAVALYEQVVLTSLREVEDALVLFGREQSRRKSLAAAVAANQRAVNLATQLYEQGRADFLTVLDAQRNLFASQDALVLSDRTVSVNLVSLYKALGGGWESEASAAPQSRPDAAGQRVLKISQPTSP